MDKFKGWMRNVYDTVVEDDYLEPLTQAEVYQMMQKSRRKLSIHHSDGRKMSCGLP